MKYTIYDNRLVNSVKRATYKKEGSNILYVKIANFMIKLTYFKKCDIYKKRGGGDDDEYKPKYTKEQMDEMRRLYKINDDMTIPDLENVLEMFMETYLKELLNHSRKIEQNQGNEQTLDDFLYEKHPISKPFGDMGEHEIRMSFNIKMLLSSLLYIYKKYDPKDNIYIENLNYLAALLTSFEEISATGVYHYTRSDYMQDDAYCINQRNIFTFILWFVKRFNSNYPYLILDKYFNVNVSDLSISGDFLEKTDKVTISNTSVTLMINYILKKIKMINKKRTYRKIDNSKTSSSSS